MLVLKRMRSIETSANAAACVAFFVRNSSSSFISVYFHLFGIFCYFISSSKFTLISSQGKDVAGVRPLVFPVTVTSKVWHESTYQLSYFLTQSLIIIMFLYFSLTVFFTLISFFPRSIVAPSLIFLFVLHHTVSYFRLCAVEPLTHSID